MTDSQEILTLFDHGKILQMEAYLKEHPDKVSKQMAKKIQDELVFFKQHVMKRINKPDKDFSPYFEDELVKLSMPLDNKSGFMGYKIILKNFKVPEYGAPAKDGQLLFGNSGIENMIPYFIEGDLYSNWTVYLTKTKITKRIDSTRFFIREGYEMPFPLSNRETEAYVQIFNNLEVDGTI